MIRGNATEGEPGEEGKPGEPGKGGGGTGGSGGKGGRGGKGATSTAWYRHRSLIGYIFIMAVVVLALQFHHISSDRDIKRSDRQTCRALEEVTDNQRFVLSTLTILIARETIFDPAPDLVSRLDAIEKRMQGLPKYDCRESLVTVE